MRDGSSLTGQTSEHLGAGEWRMHKQTDDSIRPFHAADVLTQETRHEQQVIIVHPNEIAWTVDLRDAPRECQIDSLICWVMLVRRSVLGRDVLPKEIME
jgi:hypothetical protein